MFDFTDIWETAFNDILFRSAGKFKRASDVEDGDAILLFTCNRTGVYRSFERCRAVYGRNASDGGKYGRNPNALGRNYDFDHSEAFHGSVGIPGLMECGCNGCDHLYVESGLASSRGKERKT